MRLRTHLPAVSAAFLLALGLPGCGSTESDGGGKSYPCTNPTPLITGQDTGYERCESGFTHRASVVECPSSVPRPAYSCAPAGGGGCSTDADCAADPLGYCDAPPMGTCQCQTGCRTDQDCGQGQICVCGDPIGRCVTASCKSDADCGGGKLCTSYDSEPSCGPIVYACQTGADQCGGDADCEPGKSCSMSGGRRVCVSAGCAIGRPFLVAGTERLADPAARADWCAALELDCSGLDAGSRARLAERWTEIGLMEHASVAAFARFTLQLLALGAPPELVTLAQRALGDETEHARICFALASAHAGRPVGPGPLAIDGALDLDHGLEQVLRLTVREGCIGETVAAVEAEEAAEYAVEPRLRSILRGIARDERRHAELAWRFAQWALAKAGGALDHVLEEELALALDGARQVRPPAEPRAARLRAHGVLDEPLRAELRRRVLGEVIEPCVAALTRVEQQKAA